MRFFRMPHLKWKKEQISASATVAAITATAASEAIIAPSAAAAKKKDDPQTAVTAATVVSKAHETFTSLKVGRDRRRSLASVPFYGPPLSPVPRGRKFC